MTTEKPDQDSFLAVIERKIAALKTLAESYRAAMSLGALGQPGEIDTQMIGSGTGRSEGPIDLPQGALLGKSLPAAVKLWLTAVRKKQSVREVANALREGGVESTSPNFENVVTGALHRLKATGEVLRFKDGWALAELYPASLRSSLGKDAKMISKTTRASTVRPKKARKTRPKAEQTPSAAKDNKAEMIFVTLSADPKEAYSAGEISDALNAAGTECTPGYVRVVMRRLQERGKVEKRDGKYFRVTGRTNAA